jgi:hypothetical protein
MCITSYHRIKKCITRDAKEDPIPTKWFFADHRIPLQLKLIEDEGECYIPAFFRIVAERWIPNYTDFIRFLQVKGHIYLFY